MQNAACDVKAKIIPKRRQRHHSYDESVDEPAPVIEKESVEIEAEIPAEENESVETSKQEDETASPAFEEE
jgi:hypothetical protein